jgi:GntR family transcriptional regulator of vanillate catabolism
MAESILPLNGEAFFTAHVGFHSAIVEHCGNGRLREELQLVRLTAASLRDEFPAQLRRLSRQSPDEERQRADAAVAEHAAIYEAIRAKAEDEAERLARLHIRRSFDLLPPSE